MTILLAILIILIANLPFYIILYYIDKFDKQNKIEVYVTNKDEETFKITYKRLTFARACELKREYESEGYLVEIVVQARRREYEEQ